MVRRRSPPSGSLPAYSLPVRLQAGLNRQREVRRLRVYPLECRAGKVEKNWPAPLEPIACRVERRRSGTCRDGGLSDFSDE